MVNRNRPRQSVSQRISGTTRFWPKIIGCTRFWPLLFFFPPPFCVAFQESYSVKLDLVKLSWDPRSRVTCTAVVICSTRACTSWRPKRSVSAIYPYTSVPVGSSPVSVYKLADSVGVCKSSLPQQATPKTQATAALAAATRTGRRM